MVVIVVEDSPLQPNPLSIAARRLSVFVSVH